MTAYPVLDDNTKDAAQIGTASTADEAATIFAAMMVEYHGADHGMVQPAMMVYRDPSFLSDEVRAECPNGAFEPVFARA